jgi:hypothetical protein
MSRAPNGRIDGSAFYSVADSAAFLGVVALLNSLRLVGHEEPFLLLDCGLTEEQRAVIEPHISVIGSTVETAAPAAKAVAPLAEPANVMLLMDADIIVTRHLGDLIARCAKGMIVVFPNDIPNRFFREWSHLGLGTPRSQTYVNSGHLLVPHTFRDAVLQQLATHAASVDVRRTFVGIGHPSDPFYYLDQDVLNAILATAITPDAIDVVDAGLVAYAPFNGLQCDPRTLRCHNGAGNQPYLLHHILRKPWLSPMPESAYSILLRRLLNGDDVAVRVPAHLIPLRLRRGRLARADQRRASWQAFIRDHTRGRLGIRARWSARLAQRVSAR